MLKRIIKRTLLVILVTMAVLTIAISITLNFVLKKEQLIPIIHKYTDEYLDAEVNIGDAEGVFFSTFPRAGVKLTDCEIISHAFLRRTDSLTGQSIIVDSLRSRQDTIAKVKTLVVGLDVLSYLMGDGDISLGYVRLERPVIRLVSDTTGVCNYDIVKAETEECDSANSDTTSTVLSLKHVRIENGKIAYMDRSTNSRYAVDTLNLKADGDISMEHFEMDIDIDERSTSIKSNGTRYIRRMPLRLTGHMYYDEQDGRYKVSGTKLNVASTEIDMDGWVRPDESGADMEIKYWLSSNKAENLFTAIPKDVISAAVEVKQGSVDLRGSIIGRADSTSIPVFRGTAHIDSIHAHYADMPEEIEDLTASLDLYVDKSKPDSSFIDMDIFHYKGGESEVKATLKISQLLARALFNCDVKAHIDLKNMLSVVPIDNTAMKGTVDADLRGSFYLDDAMRGDIGRAQLNGHLTMDKVGITNDSIGMDLNFDAAMRMQTTDTLSIRAKATTMNLTLPTLQIKVDDLYVGAKTAVNPDTSAIIPVSGGSFVRRAFFQSDSIRIFAKNIRTKDSMKPSEVDRRKPHINGTINVDTVFSRIYGVRSFLGDLRVSVDHSATSDTTWRTASSVRFSKLRSRTPVFTLPLELDDTQVEQEEETIRLNRSRIRAGRSSLSATGYVQNFFSSLIEHKPMELRLETTADTLDLNQMLSAIVQDTTARTELATAATATIDTTGAELTDAATKVGADQTAEQDTMRLRTSMIAVPRNIRFCINATANCVQWKDLQLTNVKTKLQTKDGGLHMENLVFDMDGTHAITTLAYRAWPLMNRAKMNLFMRWLDVDIRTMVTVFHADTLVPALNPMRGKITCLLGVEVDFDSAMVVDMKSIRAALHLSGQDITVLDNEQFAKIAKVLMFKNKERNVIDTLSMNILVDSGQVQMLPFVMNMDRYRMVVGGNQDLDMNLDYHVSVIKSPLPFKLGVNIQGSIDDLKIRPATARLKKYADGTAQKEHDEMSLELRKEVLRDSYVLSGLPMPESMRQAIGESSKLSRFALDIYAEDESEEELREIEKMRREVSDSLSKEAAADTTEVSTH